ncbi:NAD(P)/FAD-dependent oxidoreductase [Flavobacterium sp. CYK-4]|uniref:NAD(P)/FAD-dependent oxidoreductase n=1 Tax=Flavobacterium lotistagni TaxID=2709660 RepID=UPI0014081333|nr:NAD(P)/FAD-dependent oxidoreductase [Flavobacterium lotistagni]NHM06862.1 NAD(P)/FAD-dependent oxidoreductase [Flavobacterium lotistagni]
MEKAPEIVILGAGLAGLTAAIHLSKLGHKVTIIEKSTFPKHKVCGEYISNEIVPYLQWLGIDLESLQPARISSLHFSTTTGKSIRSELPMGGLGLSRFALDFYMYEKALSQGCKFVHQTVTDVGFEREQFTIDLLNGESLTADIAIGAYGKRSTLDQKLHRNFISKKSPWLAVKAHYRGEFTPNVVGLHNFKGGYCGVSKVENNLINICYLADYETFKTYRNIEQYQSEVLSENPLLRSIFQSLEPVFEKPLTISQIHFDKKNVVENHLLMIGDSAGVIHPLCGNGMAMAIHSAKMLSELIDDYCHMKIKTRKALEIEYAVLWNKTFKTRLRAGRMLSSILQRPQLSNFLIRIFIQYPPLFSQVINRTHGKKIAIHD